MDDAVNKQINEAVKAFREVRLDKKSDDELLSMIKLFRLWQANEYAPEAKQAIDAAENELGRRQKEKHQEESRILHLEAMEQNKRIHQEQLDLHSKMKSSLDELGRPHWTLSPGFWVLVVTMIFAAIAAWPVMREWIPTSEPVNKDASSPPPQSNSEPISITATQMLPVFPLEIPKTNLPVFH